ncbi:hypothetical protein [Legionella maceachernii]|uniref:Phage tail collar domain-containing protein n=1 Tax=Legionella maceachernii TaxID=466 RepID=A0A0W0WBP8_9GAMM|nr:hypothetical protein [Legionella maceachernii]KTD29667.1 hypothetical protein Lmac_0842 [Legionella maceachernii]SKA20964.1 hypothetical protein SAMN02745128_02585 [Legionella maceachernii]SUP02614.1 Uncharacterised protein [Legionella maceachernii]
MAIDSHYIPAFSIEDVILDKDTGAPLSGGLVYFEQDNQRGTLKPVYQITGSSPNYTYTQLPNPMTLSSIGTFEDSLGNPVVPYFFPYDEDFKVEYYYVRVTSSDDVPQFDREAVPYVVEESDAEVLSVITNEIANPQFAVVNFDTTNPTYVYNIISVADLVINIAPDWDMIVSCPTTGTLTVGQTKPIGSLNLPTNPGTILNINSAGLTKLQLRQRFYGSPNLWGNGYLSASFVAKTYSGTGVNLTMYYSQSNGSIVDQPIIVAALEASGAYGIFPGSISIPISNSTQNFPNAYVDIYFDIPLSVQIDITSVMLADTGSTPVTNIQYEQSSLARQIDHLYHYDYPIVPIGTVIDYYAFGTPPNYLSCNGQVLNRITYYKLLKALTNVEIVSITNGSPTITVANGAIYAIGHPIEGNGIQAGTVIANIVGNVITMSLVATATTTSALTFFCTGNGDGAISLTPTTFNTPLLVGVVMAGAYGSLLPSGGVGSFGGAATHAITINEMPMHNHLGSSGTAPVGGGGGGAIPTASNLATIGSVPVTVNVAAQGGGILNVSGAPMSLLQPTRLAHKVIRYK